MSPSNDTFLSLCLAQAELSPLHYRHGSIIVRGGKVIGQGYHTYHPGFDGPAIQELKQRLKFKLKPKSKSKLDHEQQQNQQGASTFTPFESMRQRPQR